MTRHAEVLVVGGGQAGLAVGYHLRRLGVDFAILDAGTAAGVAWPDGTQADADAIIRCTGFRPALAHLAPLALRRSCGHAATDGTRAVDEPRLHLLGYGDWAGPASATLIGVGRPAREAARQVAELLR